MRTRGANSPTGPTRDVIAIAAHWVPHRVEWIETTARAARAASSAAVVCIYTNDADALGAALAARALDPLLVTDDGGLADLVRTAPLGAVLVVQWRRARRRHPFLLTWAHKRLFRDLTAAGDLEVGRVRHLVYLEDDLRLDESALTYWHTARRELDAAGLIPGFVRVERYRGEMFATDVLGPEDIVPLPVALPDGRRAVASERPYQGMYVLDSDLATRHFSRSMASHRVLSRVHVRPTWVWAVRERASIGALVDDVPKGRPHRAAILLDPTQRLPAGCLVEHQPANYAPTPTTRLAKFPLRDLEAAIS